MRPLSFVEPLSFFILIILFCCWGAITSCRISSEFQKVPPLTFFMTFRPPLRIKQIYKSQRATLLVFFLPGNDEGGLVSSFFPSALVFSNHCVCISDQSLSDISFPLSNPSVLTCSVSLTSTLQLFFLVMASYFLFSIRVPILFDFECNGTMPPNFVPRGCDPPPPSLPSNRFFLDVPRQDSIGPP